MIIKEIDKKQHIETYRKYGYQAEKQMAFYLKRAFQDSPDIFVINDLRLVMNDDVAQIDHLIINRFGFIIVESKSVTSEISINEHGEWTRHYQKYTKGMPSPINQAKRQADFLEKFLMAESEKLLRKRLMFQSKISDFKFDVLVAISDSGIINRAENTEIPEVRKADQITESITSLMSGYAGTNKKLLTLKVNYQFADSSMESMTKYLIQSHTPKAVEAVNAPSTNQAKPKVETIAPEQKPAKQDGVAYTANYSATTCSKCQSENLEVTSGRYGYYFKCKDCDGNTAIKLACKSSSCKPQIKKQKNTFYKVCASCETSELYFTNQLVEEVQ